MNRSLARVFSSLAAGIVFGLGLMLSGMADPAKVLNFLDVAGTWDPSLMLVMGAAVVVTFVGFRLARTREQPLFAPQFPGRAAIRFDMPLIAGAVLFGAGWGLGGFCPGPALASLSLGSAGAWVFVAAMLGGMWAGRRVMGR